MLGDLHAIDKCLKDNHPAHLHHASHNPTQQQHMAHNIDKETHVDLPKTQAQNTTEPRLPPPPQTKPTPDTNPTPRKRPLNEIIDWIASCKNPRPILTMMDRIEQVHTSGHAKQKCTPLPYHTREPAEESNTKTRQRRRACHLTKSVYTHTPRCPQPR